MHKSFLQIVEPNEIRLRTAVFIKTSKKEKKRNIDKYKLKSEKMKIV